MMDEEIEKMLQEIIENLDYDLYKDIYIYDDGDVSDLVLIVKKYLGKNNEL